MRGFYLSDIGVKDCYPRIGRFVVVKEVTVLLGIPVTGRLNDYSTGVPYGEPLGLTLAANLVKLEGSVSELDDQDGLPGVSEPGSTFH
jgi:hypothetical protein